MQIQYGNFFHAENECALTITSQGIFQRGICLRIKETWNISGIVNITNSLTEGVNDLSQMIVNRVGAYSVGGHDLRLLYNGGATAHALLSANCIGGTRVVQPPSFPKGDGTEYATMRTYTVVVEGEYLAPDGLNALIEFNESLEFSGGGPRWVLIETRRGLPQRQEISEATTFKVRQSGRASGHLAWPAIPPPRFPQHEHIEQRVTVVSSPERVGSNVINWPVAWSYNFESATPLFSQPTIA